MQAQKITHNSKTGFWQQIGGTCMSVPISDYVYLKKLYKFHMMVSTFKWGLSYLETYL